jgi:hypothetical protein
MAGIPRGPQPEDAMIVKRADLPGNHYDITELLENGRGSASTEELAIVTFHKISDEIHVAVSDLPTKKGQHLMLFRVSDNRIEFLRMHNKAYAAARTHGVQIEKVRDQVSFERALNDLGSLPIKGTPEQERAFLGAIANIDMDAVVSCRARKN